MLPGNLDREGMFWALLFALPTGAGVALAAGRSVNAPPTIPLALAMGGVAAVVAFLTVAVAQATNPDPEVTAGPAPAPGHGPGHDADADTDRAANHDAGSSLDSGTDGDASTAAEPDERS